MKNHNLFMWCAYSVLRTIDGELNMRFSRYKKTFKQVVRLPLEDSGISNSIVRMSNNNIGNDGSRFARRTAVLIKNLDDNRSTVRYVMGNSGSVKHLKSDCLSLDYDAIHALGIEYKSEVNLVVKKASLFRSIYWLATSPDLNVRLSMNLALIGLVLGLLGFIPTFTQYL